MNILQAYDEIWISLKNLAMDGVKFTVTPSHSRDMEEILQKYRNQPGRLPEQLWNIIKFSVKSDSDQAAIRREEGRLSSLNIAFDTSGCAGYRYWETDWSVFIASDKEIGTMEAGRGIVKGILDSIESAQNL